MWGFHTNLTSDHPYKSRPYGWLFLERPVAYWYTTPRPGTAKEILAIGTPAIWWASLPALVATAWRWVSHRDWRAATILVCFAVGYLPWFWPAGRTEFLFYALPALPFMCLAIAFCIGLAIGPPDASIQRRRVAAGAAGTYLLAVVWNFFFLYPILAAKVIPISHWRDRIWFDNWI